MGRKLTKRFVDSFGFSSGLIKLKLLFIVHKQYRTSAPNNVDSLIIDGLCKYYKPGYILLFIIIVKFAQCSRKPHFTRAASSCHADPSKHNIHVTLKTFVSLIFTFFDAVSLINVIPKKLVQKGH